jgi:hypothetical protein
MLTSQNRNQSERTMYPLLLLVVVALEACTTMYATDPTYLSWLAQAQEQCAVSYDPPPMKTAKEREDYRKLGFQAYYGQVSRETFANRLTFAYPQYGSFFNCMANRIPLR